ncbi:MAG TPA: ABC transporter ATP-binding protein [bacterium]|nr:ABC transporter ATP-binding protein [bacterium]
MLQVQGLNVWYGDVHVIHDLSFSVEEGEIVTLIGSNGAGKTTTVNALSGVLRPRTGEIRYRGQSILGMAAHRRVGAGLVQVPEGRMLFPQMTVLENLKMGSYPGPCRRPARERLQWVYSLFPRLEQRQRQQVSTLSGGEQQMLAIGRSLMAHPRMLMLDEPSIGLAPLMVAEMFRVIQEVNRSGVAILLIEQNAAQALQLAHRGFVMEHGHLTHAGPARDLLQDETIRAAYLGI